MGLIQDVVGRLPKPDKIELSLTAHSYRDPQHNEFTQVTAQCVCGRGGWLRLAKHDTGAVKIPVRVLKEIKPNTIIENRGGKAYMVTTV
jgi:hypothetical protein